MRSSADRGDMCNYPNASWTKNETKGFGNDSKVLAEGKCLSLKGKGEMPNPVSWHSLTRSLGHRVYLWLIQGLSARDSREFELACVNVNA